MKIRARAFTKNWNWT